MSLTIPKYTIKIFLLLMLWNVAFAQSWKPLNLGWKYNYKLDSSVFITNTIWIDSAEVINGDSVFYLNRIVTHCDTCTAALGGPNPCDSCYALKNQPQFLQRKVTKLLNGIFYFNDTSKIVLNSLAALNDTWLFDSINNITAQIIAVATDSVFGNMDSVKTILLSSGDTIKFSMIYGILQYPNLYGLNSYYRLAGIEGPNLGEQVPGFWQFFDFNVGDVFHYHEWFADASAIPPLFMSYDIQYSITGVNQFSDSVFYDYSGNQWGFNVMGIPFNFPISGTVRFKDSVNHFANFYGNQLLNTSLRIKFNPWNYFTSFPDTAFDFAQYSIDSNGLFMKSFGNSSFYNNYIEVDSIIDLMNIIDVNNNGAWIGTSFITYKVGLGQTDYSYQFFEHGGEEHLVGYVKNGIPIGVIASVPTIESQNQFSIYPNPAKDKIHIEFANINSGKIFITDNAGRKILKKDFNENVIELNVSTIPTGLYFLSVQNADGVFNRKIIISRE